MLCIVWCWDPKRVCHRISIWWEQWRVALRWRTIEQRLIAGLCGGDNETVVRYSTLRWRVETVGVTRCLAIQQRDRHRSKMEWTEQVGKEMLNGGKRHIDVRLGWNSHDECPDDLMTCRCRRSEMHLSKAENASKISSKCRLLAYWLCPRAFIETLSVGCTSKTNKQLESRRSTTKCSAYKANL